MLFWSCKLHTSEIGLASCRANSSADIPPCGSGASAPSCARAGCNAKPQLRIAPATAPKSLAVAGASRLHIGTSSTSLASLRYTTWA